MIRQMILSSAESICRRTARRTQETNTVFIYLCHQMYNVNNVCFNAVNTGNNGFNDLQKSAGGLNIMYTNCDCLSKTKKTELEILILNNSPDIIAITEIYPKSSSLGNMKETFEL